MSCYGPKRPKTNYFHRWNAFYGAWEQALNLFKSRLFSFKNSRGKELGSDLASHLKILTPKQVLQRLPVGFEQVKASNISRKLKNEKRQVIYSSYRGK